MYNQAKSTLNVVICFQILSLTTFLQVTLIQCCIVLSCDLLSNFIFDNVLTSTQTKNVRIVCCDLLSNFIFDNVLTRISRGAISTIKLWFAFKFYLWQRSYKFKLFVCVQVVVVICFQILSLTTFLQAEQSGPVESTGCDLLSNFIFDNVLTSEWEQGDYGF